MSVWWESPGGPGFLPDFTCRILPKDVLSFFHPPLQPVSWFSQNDLHCDHLSAGVAPPTSETKSLEVFPSQLSLKINQRQQEAWRAAVHGVAKSRTGLSS